MNYRLNMTNCKSQLPEFQAKINYIFETFKELPEHEKHEAIVLIQSLHSRSITFMINNCQLSPPTNQYITPKQEEISDTTSNYIKVTDIEDDDDDSCINLKTSSNDEVSTKQQIPVVLHMQNLAADHDLEHSIIHSESFDENSNHTRKSMKYTVQQPSDSPFISSNVADSHVPKSSELKNLLVSRKIAVLDSPIIQQNDHAKRKNARLSDDSDELPENTSNPLLAAKKKVSKKSMVLRSAKKLKKKAMAKFIFQPDANGQSIPNRNSNTSSIQNTTKSSKTDEALKYIVSCWFCKTSFKSIEDMNSHSCFVSIKDRGDSGKRNFVYECLLCRITFLRLGHLRKHLECHLRNVCKICDSRFARQNALCRHMKLAHSEVKPQQHNCRVCKKTFTKKKSLHIHLRVHANGQLVCIECGEFFENETVYAQHIKIHFGEKSFFCKQCNVFFERKQQFEQHQMGHKRHICSECNISFPTKKLWQKHQHGTHGLHVEEKKHKCIICQKTFLRPIHLRLHLQTHTGEKPTRCFQCGKNFSNTRTLAMHMKTSSHLKHVEGQKGGKVMIDKPFLCALCGARFFRQQSLSRHMEQIHSSKTSLKCPHCEYETKCDANLKRHIKLHTGKKQYVCEKCGSTFHALATLNEHHSYVHSEKRSFVCDLCPKSFKGRSGLQRHMRIHSEVRPYKCHCNRSYKRMSHLKRHMTNAHQVVTKSLLKTGTINAATGANIIEQVTSSGSVTNNTLKSQTSTVNLSSLLNANNSFGLNQHEGLHNDNSAYDTLETTTADNYLVLSSGDININFMSNNFQNVSIPVTTSELISESDLPSNILHLSQSSLHIPSVSQDVPVVCSESTLDQLRSVALDSDDFNCSKADLNMTSSFPSFSISDGSSAFCTLPISTLLINMDLPSSHLHSSEESLVSDIEASKPLFDENTELLDMPPFSSAIHLTEAKDLATSIAIPSDTDSLWNSSSEKDKCTDSVVTSCSTLLSCSTTIESSTSKHNNILQDTSDLFGGSLLFQNDPSSIDPDALPTDELDSLSQVYNENVKQLLSIS